ncbi:MAG: hypothetical protein GTN35_02800, partial [Nitrososphaeria archaeon]|nr:hypothetical protein [Nitrososphaeria archaeon]
GIIGGIIAIIIVGLIVLQFSFTDEGNISNDFNEPKIVDVDNDGVPDEEDPFVSAPRVWQSSGPFEIDRKQYALGELVLIRMN